MIERASVEEGTLLDFGCGGGTYRPPVPATLDYVGADASASLIAHCQQTFAQGRFVVSGALPLPFADRSFDLVFASGTVSGLDEFVVMNSLLLRPRPPS